MRLRKLIERYLEFVAGEHSPATLKSYSSPLRRLCAVVGNRKLTEIKPRRLRKALAKFQARLDGKPAAPDSVRLAIVAFEQLQKFAVSRRHIRKPWLPTQLKPGGRRRDRIPTRTEFAAILRVVPRPVARFLRALRLCGARPGELSRATFGDYDSGGRVIRLAEHKTARKTGQIRKIGVGRALARLIERERQRRGGAGEIFLDRGRPFCLTRLAHQWRAACRSLGLPDALVTYSLRHEFCTRMIRAHGVAQAMHAMGHASPSMTMHYDHPTTTELAEFQDRLR